MRTASGSLSRRHFLMGSAGAVGVLAFAACGAVPAQQMADAPEGDSAEASKAEEAPKQMEAAEVIWACYNLGDVRNAVLQDTADAANDMLDNVNTTLEVTTDINVWDKLRAEFAANQTTYDIVVNQVNWVQWGGAFGIFASHDEYMARDSVTREEYLDIPSWLWKNKLYAIPFQAGGEIVYYNKQLFTDAGLDEPTADWTWDDLLNLATQMTQRQGENTLQWGLNIQNLSILEALGSFMLNNGGQVLSESRDQALYGEDAKAIEGVQFAVDLILRHQVMPWGDEKTELRTSGGGTTVGSGKVAIDWYGYWTVGDADKALGDNLGVVPIPKGPAGISTNAVAGNAWSIMELSKVKDASWEVMKVLIGKPGQDLWALTTFPALIESAPVYTQTFPKLNWDPLVHHWSIEGRDYMVTPDAGAFWSAAGEPFGPMFTGETTVQEAMRASANAANEVFAARPDELK